MLLKFICFLLSQVVWLQENKKINKDQVPYTKIIFWTVSLITSRFDLVKLTKLAAVDFKIAFAFSFFGNLEDVSFLVFYLICRCV